MKKNDKKRRGLKGLIAALIPLLGAFFLLYSAWLSGNRGEWAWFGLFFGAAIILATCIPAGLIVGEIVEVSDRLEKILKDIRDSLEKQNKGESVKKDTCDNGPDDN